MCRPNMASARDKPEVRTTHDLMALARKDERGLYLLAPPQPLAGRRLGLDPFLVRGHGRPRGEKPHSPAQAAEVVNRIFRLIELAGEQKAHHLAAGPG